jgi:hypothetical protein
MKTCIRWPVYESTQYSVWFIPVQSSWGLPHTELAPVPSPAGGQWLGYL